MEERTERTGAGSDRLLALALLLPPFVLAWPGTGSILWGDFLPSATGAGAMALATLPAGVLLVRQGTALPRGLILLAVVLLAFAGWLVLGHATDTFEQRRMIVHAAAAFVLFLGGARLTDAGRETYARGIVLLALLLCGVAILDTDDEFAGVLGNTGSIAMAALPGTLAGASLATRRGGPWRFAGGILAVIYLAYVARVPVIAGGLALAAGLIAFAAGSLKSSLRMRAAYAGLALLAVLGVLAPAERHRSLAYGPTEASPSGSSRTDSGGIEVRRRIWSSSLAMLADHPWTGVGPGQFAARFPPYRDPQEIELSTHGRAIGAETEVEHPHEDWIAPALELGSIAGVAWIAFLVAVAWRSWSSLRAGDSALEPLALGSIGILAYALVHAPLTREPASACVAAVLFGAVLGRRSPAAPGIARRGLPIAAAIVLFVVVPHAWAFVRHGVLVSDWKHPTIENALESCPDSPLALSIRAQAIEGSKRPGDEVIEAWSRVVAVRPEQFGARRALASWYLDEGNLARAKREARHASEIDPRNPSLPGLLRIIEREEEFADPTRIPDDEADLSPEACYARSRKARADGNRQDADFFEARAHLLWAREHVELGRFDDAVRSYRQCVRVTRDHVKGGAVRVRLELAAALGKAGRRDDARAELQEIEVSEEDRGSLPAWAAEALRGLE